MNKIYIAWLYVALGFITLLVILTKGKPVLVRKKYFLACSYCQGDSGRFAKIWLYK